MSDSYGSDGLTVEELNERKRVTEALIWEVAEYHGIDSQEITWAWNEDGSVFICNPQGITYTVEKEKEVWVVIKVDLDIEYLDVGDELFGDIWHGWPEHLPQYKRSTHRRFVRSFMGSEWEHSLKHYKGRFFYEGPSITCEYKELLDVGRLCSVDLQWDQLGAKDIIVYPG